MELSSYINWAISHPFLFFLVVLFQYIILASNQTRLKRSVIAKPLYIAFALQDLLLNWLMSVWFIDLPETPLELVTGRMSRYKRTYGEIHWSTRSKIETWRYNFAVRLCGILNKYDEGHC